MVWFPTSRFKLEAYGMFPFSLHEPLLSRLSRVRCSDFWTPVFEHKYASYLLSLSAAHILSLWVSVIHLSLASNGFFLRRACTWKRDLPHHPSPHFEYLSVFFILLFQFPYNIVFVLLIIHHVSVSVRPEYWCLEGRLKKKSVHDHNPSVRIMPGTQCVINKYLLVTQKPHKSWYLNTGL